MSQPLKIAILQNDDKSEGYWEDFREAFVHVISAVEPDAQITFFDPIELQAYPELSDNYDLIILSGGNAEHNGHVPWVLKMQAFIRAVAQNRPFQKLVGICWGHQAIHKSLGGTVDYRKEAEVQMFTKLTPEGRKFFPFAEARGTLAVNLMHREDVREPGPNFIPLAEDHLSFISTNNSILTLQAHPEIGPLFAERIIRKDFEKHLGQAEFEHALTELDCPLDNEKVWERILQWVRESIK